MTQSINLNNVEQNVIETKVVDFKQIKLKDATLDEIKLLMLQEKLLNMAALGRHFDISRERVRQIFQEREIDFRSLKKEITVQVHQKDISNPNEEWKLIDFHDTAHNYYVSNQGRVARELNKTINGATFVQKKALKPSAGKCGRLRVNLSLRQEDGSTKPFTVYVHSLVAKAFKEYPEGGSIGVKHLDGDVKNNFEDNLVWR